MATNSCDSMYKQVRYAQILCLPELFLVIKVKNWDVASQRNSASQYQKRVTFVKEEKEKVVK